MLVQCEECEGTMQTMLYCFLIHSSEAMLLECQHLQHSYVWNTCAPTAASVTQGRADAGNGAGQEQDEEEGGSIQGSLEGSAARAGTDLDAESSVNSLLGPTLGQHLPPP